MVYKEGESFYYGRGETALFQFPTEERQFLCRCFLAYRIGWGVCFRVFRRDIVECNGLRFLPRVKISEDMDFCFRYLLYCRNLYYIAKLFYIYWQHKASVTHTNTPQKWAECMLRVVRQQEQTLSGLVVLQPFYIYSGVLLTGFVDSYHFMKARSAEYRLSQAVECFEAMEDWIWLLEKTGKPVRIGSSFGECADCVWGGRIRAFYQCILYKDARLFCRWDRVQKYYEKLRDIKGWMQRRWLAKRWEGHIVMALQTPVDRYAIDYLKRIRVSR